MDDGLAELADLGIHVERHGGSSGRWGHGPVVRPASDAVQWPLAAPSRLACTPLGSVRRQVDRLGCLTQALAAGVEEGVEDEAGQDHHQGLVDDLVAGGERHPHGEQDAGPGHRRGRGPAATR